MTMTNNIGITADLHFGRGGEQGIARQLRVFNEIADGMIAAQVSRMIIAGDLFNKYVSFGEYEFSAISAVLKRVMAAGIAVDIIPGNHDMDRAGVRSAVEPFAEIGANIYGKMTQFNVEPWQITFIPWLTKSSVKSALATTDKNAQDVVLSLHDHVTNGIAELYRWRTPADKNYCQLCVFHASLVGFSPCSTAASIVGTDFVLDPADIMALDYDYMIGGHFHRRQAQNNIAYVGAPERLDFGEANNPCGWLELTPERNEAPIWHELSSPRIFRTIEKNTAAPYDCCAGAIIKLRPELSHHDTLDRDALAAPFIAAGAESVIIEPVYTDEIAVRSREIKADLPTMKQFDCWAAENQDKTDGGAVNKLLAFENEQGFPADLDIEAAIKAIQ